MERAVVYIGAVICIVCVGVFAFFMMRPVGKPEPENCDDYLAYNFSRPGFGTLLWDDCRRRQGGK